MAGCVLTLRVIPVLVDPRTGGLAMTKTDIIFAGSIPSLYDKYLGSVLFEPFADDLAKRLPKLSAGRVLETAAGTGIVTRALRNALPAGAKLTSTDLNSGMMAIAQEKFRTSEQVT